MITPTGILSKIIALVIFLVLMVTGITIPLSAAFDINMPEWDYIVDAIFCFDLVLGFFSGYLKKDGTCERRCTRIIYNYLKSWFLPDLVTSLPYDDMFGTKGVSFLKFIKFVKLIKFIRLFKYTKKIKELITWYNISSITLRLGVEAVLVVYLTHTAACIYYFTCSMDTNMDP